MELQRSIFPEPNPCLFPMIIHQSLGHLDFRSLKQCRTVCKIWEQEANKYLKIKKYPLQASNEKIQLQLQAQDYNFLLIPPDIGPDFFNITKNLISVINQEYYHIKYLELQNDGWTFAQILEILQLLPKLRELTLSTNFVLPKVDHTLKNLSTQQQLIPSLETLHLNLRDDNLQNLANIEFLFELYAMSPNLRELKCGTDLLSEKLNCYTTIFSKLFYRSAIEAKVRLSRCNHINYLDINVDLRNEDIDLLITAKFPLKTLHIPIDVTNSTSKVEELLESLKNTLKRLKITYRNCIRTAPSFDSMKNLEYLSFHGWYDVLNGEPLSYPSSELIPQTRALYVFPSVTLSFLPCYLENFESVLNSLKEFQMNSVYYIPNDVFNFSILFPNLKTVKMSFLNDETLRSIFENFPQLETLVGTDGEFSDSGITGISPIVQELLENGVMNECKFERLREFPNVLSMKCLKTLELASPNVTNYGVINGIALCFSVQELSLNFPRMTDPSLKKISENLNLDILDIKWGTFSTEVINSVKLKMNGKGQFTLFLMNQSRHA